MKKIEKNQLNTCFEDVFQIKVCITSVTEDIVWQSTFCISLVQTSIDQRHVSRCLMKAGLKSEMNICLTASSELKKKRHSYSFIVSWNVFVFLQTLTFSNQHFCMDGFFWHLGLIGSERHNAKLVVPLHYITFLFATVGSWLWDINLFSWTNTKFMKETWDLISVSFWCNRIKEKSLRRTWKRFGPKRSEVMSRYDV